MPKPVFAAVVLPLLVAGCGGKGEPATTGTRAASRASVSIENFAFAPQTVTVRAGTTVTWTNKDGFAHSVKPAGGGFEASEPLDEGDTYEQTFAEPGTYAYLCGIHNSMTGTLVVT